MVEGERVNAISSSCDDINSGCDANLWFRFVRIRLYAVAIDIIWDILRQPHLSLAARCEVRPPTSSQFARRKIETIAIV